MVDEVLDDASVGTGDAAGEAEEAVDKGGRPWHRVTADSRRTVREAIGLGLQQNNVARLLGISPKTLRRHYRYEIDTGVDQVNFDVARALYTRASSGKDTIASIFMLKARAGWKDTASQDAALPQKIEVTFALPESVTEDKKEMIDITPEEHVTPQEGDGGR